MKLLVIAVGQRVPDWAQTAWADYAKRFPPELRLELKAIKTEPRSGGKTTEQIMTAERQRIEAALPSGTHVVRALLIGGPDGLHPALRQGAHEYVLYAAPLVAALEMKHPDIKKKNEELHAPAPLGVMQGVEQLASGITKTLGSGLTPGTPKKKTPQELWGIAPSANSSYNKPNGSPYTAGHPFALDDPLKPPLPKKIV